MLRFLVVGALAGLALGLATVLPRASARPSSSVAAAVGGHLIFWSDRDGDGDVYAVGEGGGRAVAGTVRLTRAVDGRVRTIAPPGGAVDAELELDGLFYAYNVGGTAVPGRVVFMPFGELFP